MSYDNIQPHFSLSLCIPIKASKSSLMSHLHKHLMSSDFLTTTKILVSFRPQSKKKEEMALYSLEDKHLLWLVEHNREERQALLK